MDHVAHLQEEAELARNDGLGLTAMRFDAAATEIERLRAIASACIEFNAMQPLPIHIMEAVHRWQEFKASSAVTIPDISRQRAAPSSVAKIRAEQRQAEAAREERETKGTPKLIYQDGSDFNFHFDGE